MPCCNFLVPVALLLRFAANGLENNRAFQEAEVEQREDAETEALQFQLLQRQVAVLANGDAVEARKLGFSQSSPQESIQNASSISRSSNSGPASSSDQRPQFAARQAVDAPGPGKYNNTIARAFAALAQAATCGPKQSLRAWRCKACRQAGFEISSGTSRMISQSQYLEQDSTFIHVVRLMWSKGSGQNNRYKPRVSEDLKHAGEDCYQPCGSRSGFCAWCGVGKVCCSRGEDNGPAECLGATGFGGSFHNYECAVPAKKRQRGPVQHLGSNCWIFCGKAGGYCSWCGTGNACCRMGYAKDPIECRNATGFSASHHHECVAPASNIPQPGPSDFGCAIAIRGTRTLTNKLNNAMFWSEPISFEGCSNCRVFAGFWAIWQGVEEKVVSALNDNSCVPGGAYSSLLITGHSMGAAVATLAMLALQARGYTVVQSYNFESPRVGNLAFSAAFRAWFGGHGHSAPLWRVTRKKDPVPHLPPTPWYRHVGFEAYFPTEDHTYIVCEDEEDEHCADRYNLVETLPHSDPWEHCRSAQAPHGDICHCYI